MSSDPNKKSARTFQCRDVMWETFEQMARELECSVDYLINEAMKQYARQRSYGSRTPFPGLGRPGEQPPSSDHRNVGREPMSAPMREREPATAPPPAPAAAIAGGPRVGPLPPPPSRVPPPPARASAGLPLPPPPGRGGGGGHALPPPPTRGMPAMPSRSAPPPPPRGAPPPIPRGPGPASHSPPPPAANGFPAPPPHGATLAIIYQGEKVSITKDRFVIGRGKQSSDLTLKDPNVSRQHAMIEFQNGVYFMVDMGSTNGVEYNGQRIARKQIAEGDVFKICDHDLIFTYR